MGIYFEKAINRIEKIDWNKQELERPLSKQYVDSKLVGEYLRRLALFLIHISSDTRQPLLFNGAKYIGFDFKGIFSKVPQENKFFSNYMKYICHFFLEWAVLVDIDERTAIQFKDIYEPIVTLFENGGGVGIGMHHGELIGGDGFGAFPIHTGIKYYAKLVQHFLNEYANFKPLYHPSCISIGRLLAVH